jgi:hypothetical protein
LSFASGAILVAIHADDKYLKSIHPITLIDALADYIKLSNRALRLVGVRIIFGACIALSTGFFWRVFLRGLH